MREKIKNIIKDKYGRRTLLTFVVVLILAGVSFAWFNATVTGNEDAEGAEVTTANLSITYNGGPEYNQDNILPGWSGTKTFRVENTGDATATYNINWETLTNGFTNQEDMVYSITSTNDGGTLEETQLPSTGTNIPIITTVAIPVNTIQTYTITFRYINRASAQDDQGSSFSGKIVIDEGQVNTRTIESLTDNTPLTQDTTPGTFAGSGTSGSPYQVESIEDLVALTNNVEGGTTYSGKYFELTTDLNFESNNSYVDPTDTTITVSPTSNEEDSQLSNLVYIEKDEEFKTLSTGQGIKYELTHDEGFKPIGNNTTNFSGTLDGNNHTISNLYINRPDTNYVGLFGCSTGILINVTLDTPTVSGNNNIGGLAGNSNGTITNVTLTNAAITGTGTGQYTGGLIGYNSSGTISDVTLENAMATGNDYTGGMVGYSSYGTITNVTSNNATVTGNDYTGGLIGASKTPLNLITIEGGSVTGTGTQYTGGLVGYVSTTTIINNQVDIDVTGTQYTGGLVGYSYHGTIQSNTYEGDVEGTNYVSGLIASGSGNNAFLSGSVTGTGSSVYRTGSGSNLALETITVNGVTTPSTNVTSNSGQDISSINDLNDIILADSAMDTEIGGQLINGYYWGTNNQGDFALLNTTDNPLPTFDLSGSGTAEDPYLIYDVADLRLASYKVDKAYKLMDDIDFDLDNGTFYTLSTYVNKFTGTFDGNNKTINNLEIDTEANYVDYLDII